MFTSKDQVKLSNIYSLIEEMNLSPVLQGNELQIATVMPTVDTMEHEEEADSAVAMAASDLYKIERIVSDLHTKIESLPKIEGWVAAKITLAADYLSSVHDWITHEMQADCGCDQDNSAEMFSLGYEDEEI
jgi:hypothetical protein